MTPGRRRAQARNAAHRSSNADAEPSSTAVAARVSAARSRSSRSVSGSAASSDVPASASSWATAPPARSPGLRRGPHRDRRRTPTARPPRSRRRRHPATRRDRRTRCRGVGVETQLDDLAARRHPRRRRRGGRQFVEAVVAAGHDDAVATVGERAGDPPARGPRTRSPRVRRPDARGWSAGPRTLKTVGMPSSLRGADAYRSAGWNTGAKQKPIRPPRRRRATPAASRVMSTPRLSRTSAPPLRRSARVAVFSRRGSRRGDDDRRHRRDVHGVARSPPCRRCRQPVGRRAPAPSGRASRRRTRSAHRARALDLHRDAEGGDLRRRRRVGHDLVHRPPRVGRRQVLPPSERAEDGRPARWALCAVLMARQPRRGSPGGRCRTCQPRTVPTCRAPSPAIRDRSCDRCRASSSWGRASATITDPSGTASRATSGTSEGLDTAGTRPAPRWSPPRPPDPPGPR